MDMQGALRARLLAAAPVTALVGQRIYWLDRPQASALPSITLQTIAGERSQTHDGFQSTQASTIQCDIWASSYGQGRQILEEVIAALAPPQTGNGIEFGRMFFEPERDLIEQLATTNVYRTSIDLIVWHHPA